ncbi:MAG: PfkB family carbohydrate kinase [Nitrososphaerota archaeon]
MSCKIGFVGHLTIDEIIYKDGIVRTSPGGTVFYSSLTSSRLNSKSQVYSVIGEDYPEDYLRILLEAGVDYSRIVIHKEHKTTMYRIVYRDGDRELFLLERAPRINIEEIGDVDIVYLGPVAGEITVEDVRKVVGKFKTMLDPQGILRKPLQDRRIILEKNFKIGLLRGVWIIRLTREEAFILTDEVEPLDAVRKIQDAGVENVILSMGYEGVITANKKKRYFIPSYSKAKVVDPTGAGDVLGGAFLTEYLSSGDFLWASCIGVSAASISIEDYGAEAILSKNFKKRVIERSYEIIDKIREIYQ